MKTGNEIEAEFYQAVKNTTLAAQVNGEVYRDDFRPRDSVKEDIIVRLTAVTSGQVQSGVVTLLIYTPDIQVRGKSGVRKRNSARLTELESLAAQAVEEIAESLDGYDQVMTETGIRSYRDDNEQHFVSVRISFEYLNENNY